ncbi:MAG: hypothetical protein II062_05445 [Oscillospiraceae bacterium]|nr:hypothetical protein [Oscillospiraceae bacterium]
MAGRRVLRAAALLLACLLLLTACGRQPELPSGAPAASGTPSEAAEPGAGTEAGTESGTELSHGTESPSETPAESAAPADPNDEALIRWQNGGQRDYLPDAPVEMVPFSGMAYVRPDTEALYGEFDKLITRAETEDAEALLSDYYRLYSDYISFYSMDAIANIRYSLNTADGYYQAEYDFCENEKPTLEEKLEVLNKAFAASPARSELERLYFGADYFEQYDDYEVYTNPDYLRLSREEAALLSEYRELSADPRVSYQGETRSLHEWMESDSYAVYLGALKAYYQQYNEALGEIYLRLVRVRQKLAEALGYDSYAEYSYEISYFRDYSPAQGSAFLREIREQLLPVLEDALRSPSVSMQSARPASERELTELVRSAAENIGGPVWDAWRFMQAYGLCDISASAVKTESSFQSYIFDYEAPFVLVNAEGTSNDYSTFAHEFGHFADAYYNYGANEDVETAETFSQAMEYLALRYNDLLSEDQRERMLRKTLFELLETFVYQAAYADFEARVYALEPAQLSVETVNELYRQICRDYGIYDKSYDFYYSQGWIDVIHFFEAPYYIISYCVSAETALQVCELEAERDGQGVAAYFRLLDRSYEAGVQQVMEDAGLQSPFREEVLKQAAAFFRQELGLN